MGGQHKTGRRRPINRRRATGVEARAHAGHGERGWSVITSRCEITRRFQVSESHLLHAFMEPTCKRSVETCVVPPGSSPQSDARRERKQMKNRTATTLERDFPFFSSARRSLCGPPVACSKRKVGRSDLSGCRCVCLRG